MKVLDYTQYNSTVRPAWRFWITHNITVQWGRHEGFGLHTRNCADLVCFNFTSLFQWVLGTFHGLLFPKCPWAMNCEVVGSYKLVLSRYSFLYRCAGRIIGVSIYGFWGGPFSTFQIKASRMPKTEERWGAGRKRGGRKEEGVEEEEEEEKEESAAKRARRMQSLFIGTICTDCIL